MRAKAGSLLVHALMSKTAWAISQTTEMTKQHSSGETGDLIVVSSIYNILAT